MTAADEAKFVGAGGETLRRLGIGSASRGFWSSRPAEHWEHALVAGNGTLGALVYGRVERETIVVNRAGLFMPGDAPRLPPNTAAHLERIRSWIEAGEGQRAASFVYDLSQEEGYQGCHWTDPLIPAFDVALEPDVSGPVRDYARGVDFTTGVVSTVWRDDRGEFRRRLFVSRAHDVIVLEVTSSDGAPLRGRVRLLERTTAEGNEYSERMRARGIESVAITSRDGVLSYRSRFRRAWPGGLQGYEGVVRVVVSGGRCSSAETSVEVEAAASILLLIRVEATNDMSVSRLPELEGDLHALEPSFDALLDAHTPLHAELVTRARLELFGAGHELSSEALLERARTGAEAARALLEKQFDACRYALIASSAPALPPTLQGIWSGTWSPPWSSDFTQNGNLQMAIAANLCGNLAECMKSYLEYQWSLIPDYRKNARRLFDCRGIVVPSRTSSHGLNIHFNPTWCMTFWTAGAGWAAHFFYDYYLYTGDERFLEERALPFMREVADFYEDFLIEDAGGEYRFNPSYSPENNPRGSDSQATLDATMDMAVARELLENLTATLDRLGDERASRRYRAMLAKLPDYRVNEDGVLAEWLDPKLADNYEHRHASHLYALFDGLSEPVAQSAELASAFARAVELRMQVRRDQGGGIMAFGLAQLGLVAASLGDGELCHEIASRLSTDYFRASLVSTHDPGALFNVDLCGGLPALLLRMLLDSRPGVVDLLPALPKAWPRGRVTGLRARGRIHVVALAWDADAVTATLKSEIAQRVLVTFPARFRATGSADAAGSALSPTDSSSRRKGTATTSADFEAGVPLTLALRASTDS